MKFVFHKNDNISKMSWCAIVCREQSDIHVYHGSSVETHGDVFVEGAWDGEYGRFEFENAKFFCGTGGKIIFSDSERPDKALFATPNHILERLCSISYDNKTVVSNSIPFALALSGFELDPEYNAYERDFNSILKGLKEYTRTIQLKGNRAMRLHYYCNIIIDENLNLQEEEKAFISPFIDFHDYYQRITEAIGSIHKNAADKNRKIRYGSVTTISKGYDAVACAVIAKKYGCDTAVTFNEPSRHMNDCGEEIAKILGYKNIIKGNAEGYLNNKNLEEAEFTSSGELGSAVIFSLFDKVFADNIVYFGERGDKLWDRNYYNVNDSFKFEGEIFTATSRIENRLRVGYVLIPLPLFGAKQWASINEISNSQDMSPYSTGNDYDRPIPRRIIEETGGVPREMFGQVKIGAGTNFRFDNLARLRKRMSGGSYDSFAEFYRANKKIKMIAIYNWIAYLSVTIPIYLNYFFSKVGLKFSFRDPNLLETVNPGAPSYLFPWGISEMKKIYGRIF